MTGKWHPRQDLESLGAARSKPPKRAVRVADAIRNELSVLLLQRSRDPRLLDVFIHRVVVSNDLRHAKVYYGVSGQADLEAIGKGLERATGFMRSHLARTLNMQFTPELRFWYDEHAAQAEEVEKLLADIAKEQDERQHRT